MKYLRASGALALAAAVVAILSMLLPACFGSDNVTPAQIRQALADAGLLNDSGLLPDAFTLGDAGVPLYTVSGTVIGLQGSGLVLEGDGVEDIAIDPNGGQPVGFSFPTAVPMGTPYSIAVKTQPDGPSQTCNVVTPAGTVGDAAVSAVVVQCDTNNFTVGGTVTGLLGSGLVILENGGADSVLVGPGAATFTFPTPVPSGSTYSVGVSNNPRGPSQSCAVLPGTGSGTVGDSNVTSIQVVCTINSYAVSVNVLGLQGTGMVLEDNGADDLTVSSNGMHTFSHPVQSGADFNVTIKTQPGNPVQTCKVSGGSGKVAGGPVNTVVVNCNTGLFSVGGTVSGMVGSGLVLNSTVGGNIVMNGDGTFAFPPVASGTGYTVTVQTPPSNPNQVCNVVNGNGTVTTHDVTDVTVTCTGFTVGGTVTGLGAGGLTLFNNGGPGAGGDSVLVRSDGFFQFPLLLVDNQGYGVTIGMQPSDRICTVTMNGIGTIAGSSVNNVQVACVPFMFGLSVTITLEECGTPLADESLGRVNLGTIDVTDIVDAGPGDDFVSTPGPMLWNGHNPHLFQFTHLYATGAPFTVTLDGGKTWNCVFPTGCPLSALVECGPPPHFFSGTMGSAPINLTATCNICD